MADDREELLAGRYRRRTTLGTGAMGEVWLADDQVLGRQVAVKKLRTDMTAGLDTFAVDRMVREARIAARLHHPNAVAVFDLIGEVGQPYIVMEYVDGESLSERLRRKGTLPIEEAAHIIGQVSGALDAAHRAELVHRDIKPANVLIDQHGTAKLADFGIARSNADPAFTNTGELIGTLAYMAPEVARDGASTPASDIWSLGAALYAAVEGRAPFATTSREHNTAAMLLRLVTEQVPEPQNAGTLAGFLMQMLDPDPTERPTAGQVQRRLAAFVHASESGAPEQPTVTAARSRPDLVKKGSDGTVLNVPQPTDVVGRPPFGAVANGPPLPGSPVGGPPPGGPQHAGVTSSPSTSGQPAAGASAWPPGDAAAGPFGGGAAYESGGSTGGGSIPPALPGFSGPGGLGASGGWAGQGTPGHSGAGGGFGGSLGSGSRGGPAAGSSGSAGSGSWGGPGGPTRAAGPSVSSGPGASAPPNKRRALLLAAVIALVVIIGAVAFLVGRAIAGPASPIPAPGSGVSSSMSVVADSVVSTPPSAGTSPPSSRSVTPTTAPLAPLTTTVVVTPSQDPTTPATTSLSTSPAPVVSVCPSAQFILVMASGTTVPAAGPGEHQVSTDTSCTNFTPGYLADYRGPFSSVTDACADRKINGTKGSDIKGWGTNANVQKTYSCLCPETGLPVLSQGSTDWFYVSEAQRTLVRLGMFDDDNFTGQEDYGEFGSYTAGVVAQFQATYQLPANSVIDAATWVQLITADPSC